MGNHQYTPQRTGNLMAGRAAHGVGTMEDADRQLRCRHPKESPEQIYDGLLAMCRDGRRALPVARPVGSVYCMVSRIL